MVIWRKYIDLNSCIFLVFKNLMFIRNVSEKKERRKDFKNIQTQTSNNIIYYYFISLGFYYYLLYLFHLLYRYNTRLHIFNYFFL